jgi:glyoxylase-like metal-dependent hydrolase (beta-lactamase superfamily II)
VTDVRETGFGVAEPVADGIWSIRMPLGAPNNPSVLCYVVLDAAGAPHLVDSGIESGLDFLHAGLGQLGFGLADVRSVTMTHLHPDHAGLAGAVRAAGGAVTAIHARDADAAGHRLAVSRELLEAWGVPQDDAAPLAELVRRPYELPPIDVRLEDGVVLAIAGRDLRVVYTPGHTDGHACIISEREQLLFTGDHLLPDQFAGVGLGAPIAGNPLDDYRRSLERIREFDGYLALPGHGWTFRTIGERIDETLAHHGRRTSEVAAVLAAHPTASVWEIASQLTWTAGWDALAGFYLVSALRQTAWHRELVEAA